MAIELEPGVHRSFGICWKRNGGASTGAPKSARRNSAPLSQPRNRGWPTTIKSMRYMRYMRTTSSACRCGNVPVPAHRTYRLYSEWEGDMRQELAAKRDELAKLEAQPVDKQLIINNARTRLLQLFEGAARDAGLLPPKPVRKTPEPRRIVENFSPVSTNSGEWMTFVELGKLKNVRAEIIKGSALRFPDGKEISVNSGIDLLVQTAEWLVREGLLTQSNCPFRLETMRSNYLIHSIRLIQVGKYSNPISCCQTVCI